MHLFNAILVVHSLQVGFAFILLQNRQHWNNCTWSNFWLQLSAVKNLQSMCSYFTALPLHFHCKDLQCITRPGCLGIGFWWSRWTLWLYLIIVIDWQYNEDILKRKLLNRNTPSSVRFSLMIAKCEPLIAPGQTYQVWNPPSKRQRCINHKIIGCTFFTLGFCIGYQFYSIIVLSVNILIFDHKTPIIPK